jgi:hypothetical protein
MKCSNLTAEILFWKCVTLINSLQPKPPLTVVSHSCKLRFIIFPLQPSLWRRQHLLVLRGSDEWLATVMQYEQIIFLKWYWVLLVQAKGNSMMLIQLLWWLHSHYLLLYVCWDTFTNHHLRVSVSLKTAFAFLHCEVLRENSHLFALKT